MDEGTCSTMEVKVRICGLRENQEGASEYCK